MRTDSSHVAPTTRSKRAWVPYAWVVGTVWVMPAVVLTVLRATLPDYNAGFGCTLTPADSVELLGIVALPFLLLAGLIAIAGVAVRQAASARNRRPGG